MGKQKWFIVGRLRIAVSLSWLVFLLFGRIVDAEKPPVWEQAHVISQDVSSQRNGVYAARIGTGVAAIPLYGRSNIVTVETKDYRYQWAESGRNTIILTVNDDVLFYRDGDWFVVLDNKNRKHKFSLVGVVKK